MNFAYLCGLSMLTPLGASPRMVKTAIVAGMSSYQDIELAGDADSVVKFSPVPAGALKMRIPDQLPGMSVPQIRLLHIAAFALADIEPQLPETPVPLFLAGPEPYYQHAGVNQTFVKHLITTTHINLDYSHSRYIAGGRAGAIEAIAAAFEYLEKTGADYALVGGIDSYYDVRTLGILGENKRLAGGDRFDGFTPGEGSAFLLLASPNAPQSIKEHSLLKVHRPAIVHEPGHLLGNDFYTGEAQAIAVSQAIKNAAVAISTIYTSENGEMHYSKEAAITNLRNQQHFCANRKVYRPAEFFGDLGAAFVPVAIGLASLDVKSDSKAVLVCASSDSGARGAMCLSGIQSSS